MKYQEIMSLLTKKANKLKNLNCSNEWAVIARHFVTLQNAYCEATNNFDDFVYVNDDENLQNLLPSNPLDAFTSGLIARDSYYSTDEWLTLDGYGHPVTASDCNLIDNFVFIEDIARWLASLDEEEQAEVLEYSI